MRKKTKRSQIDFSDTTSLTEQHHKDEVSIQNIMKKFVATGVATHVNEHQGSYMDCPDPKSFHEAYNIIAAGESMFESVPSHIRKAMNNDAATYIEFMQDPKNREKIEAFGLDASHLPEPPQAPKIPPADKTPITPVITTETDTPPT